MIAPLFRAAGDDDLPFILSSWLESLRSGPDNSPMTTYSYRRYVEPEVREVLGHHSTRVAVAADPGDASSIIGYVVFGPGNVVHYAYVKQAFRRNGIFRRLLSEAGIDLSKTVGYTFRSQALRAILRSVPEVRVEHILDPRESLS